MPNTKAPVTLGAPSAEIVGNSIMVPLLSWLKSETGFTNCLAVGTAATTQPPFLAEEHAWYIPGLGEVGPGVAAQYDPQSCSSALIPMMPLALSVLAVLLSVPVQPLGTG